MVTFNNSRPRQLAVLKVLTYLLEVSGIEVVVQSLFKLGQGQVDGRRNRPKSDLVRLPHVHQKDVL